MIGALTVVGWTVRKGLEMAWKPFSKGNNGSPPNPSPKAVPMPCPCPGYPRPPLSPTPVLNLPMSSIGACILRCLGTLCETRICAHMSAYTHTHTHTGTGSGSSPWQAVTLSQPAFREARFTKYPDGPKEAIIWPRASPGQIFFPWARALLHSQAPSSDKYLKLYFMTALD
jgi:hypothetical protein